MCTEFIIQTDSLCCIECVLGVQYREGTVTKTLKVLPLQPLCGSRFFLCIQIVLLCETKMDSQETLTA